MRLSELPEDISHIYIFVRQDLDINQITVQASHAAFAVSQSRVFKYHPNFVLIGVKDKEAISDILYDMQLLSLECYLWREEDLNNEETALVVVPKNGIERMYFKRFKCLDLSKDYFRKQEALLEYGYG